MTVTKIATVTLEELREEVRSAVADALAQERRKVTGGVERVSAIQASRIIRRAKGFLLLACAKGWLPAVRDGRGWKIAVSDLDAWARAGCPERGSPCG